MKLIETPSSVKWVPVDVAALPMKMVTFRWQTGVGEIYIEVTASDKGLDLYCNGEGSAEITINQESINAASIEPKFGVVNDNT